MWQGLYHLYLYLIFHHWYLQHFRLPIKFSLSFVIDPVPTTTSSRWWGFTCVCKCICCRSKTDAWNHLPVCLQPNIVAAVNLQIGNDFIYFDNNMRAIKWMWTHTQTRLSFTSVQFTIVVRWVMRKTFITLLYYFSLALLYVCLTNFTKLIIWLKKKRSAA